MGRRTGRGLIALVILASAACGQKAGVGDPLAVAATPTTGPSRGTTGPTPPPAPAAPPPPAQVSVRSTSACGPSPMARRAGPVTSGPAAPNPPTTVPGPTDCPRAATGAAIATTLPPSRGQPVDRTGVSHREIIVCVQAPISGAAPVPKDFQRVIGLYWRWLADRGGLSAGPSPSSSRTTSSTPVPLASCAVTSSRSTRSSCWWGSAPTRWRGLRPLRPERRCAQPLPRRQRGRRRRPADILRRVDHLLEADCSQRRYRTVATLVSSF
jgi:hypothetical protein